MLTLGAGDVWKLADDVLARLGGDAFAWQVPALREELVTALIKSLPKDLRRNFVPAPDTARAVLAQIDPDSGPLLDALQRELRRRTGVLVPVDAFDLDKLPAHLRMTFVVENTDGQEVARGKDLDALQHRLAGSARAAVADAVAGDLQRKGYQGRTIGIKLRFDDFRSVTRDLTLPAPTAQAEAIREAMASKAKGSLGFILRGLYRAVLEPSEPAEGAKPNALQLLRIQGRQIKDRLTGGE